MATNINDLPSDEISNNEAPVQKEMHDSRDPPPGQEPPPTQLSSDDVNKIISGLQRASQSNLTALPSRDIPMTNTQITMDEQTGNPNYIPHDNRNNYINNEDRFDTIVKKQFDDNKHKTKRDELLDELQTPILVTILFLIFQLPFVRKNLLYYLPHLFLKDGNLSLSGIIFKSLIFGTAFYGCVKTVNYLSDI